MSLLLALVDSVGGTVQAICMNIDGSLTYRVDAGGSDMKLYLNNGQIYARLSPVGGDKILTISSGAIVAT